jgi:NitT/TauT family transport system substrate-binding protein
MSAEHARRFSRRRFLGELTLAGTAGFLGLHAGRVAAEPPPKTTRIRLVRIPSICQAPQAVSTLCRLSRAWSG